MTEARLHARTHVELRPRYRVPTTFHYVEAPCVDLSLGGMFLEVSEPADLGTLVKIECDAGTGQGIIIGVGRVVWRRLKGGLGAPRGMGVKFVKLRGSSLRVISRVIEGSHGVMVEGKRGKSGALDLADRLGQARNRSVPTDSAALDWSSGIPGRTNMRRDLGLMAAGVALGMLGWLLWSLLD